MLSSLVAPTSSFSKGTAGTFLLLSSCLVLVPCVSCCQHHVFMRPSLKYHSRFNSCSLRLSKSVSCILTLGLPSPIFASRIPRVLKDYCRPNAETSFRLFFRASWYRDRHLNIGSFLYNLCGLSSQSLSFPTYKTERIEPA